MCLWEVMEKEEEVRKEGACCAVLLLAPSILLLLHPPPPQKMCYSSLLMVNLQFRTKKPSLLLNPIHTRTLFPSLGVLLLSVMRADGDPDTRRHCPPRPPPPAPRARGSRAAGNCPLCTTESCPGPLVSITRREGCCCSPAVLHLNTHPR